MDIIATNVYAFILKSETIETVLSDHKLIYTVLNKRVTKQKVTYKSTRCFKHFDKEASNKDLECVPFNYIFDDVNDICWAWEKMYEDILDEHAPVRLKKCNNATGKSKFITPEIRKAMWKRNMRKRKYYKTKSSADWESYRIIRNRVVTMRSKSIKNHFEQLCYSGAGNPRDFWN